jgi:transcriptional regulator with XRE-family HTH domain
MGERGLTGRDGRGDDPLMTEILTFAETSSLRGEEFRIAHLSDLLRGARARAPVPPELAEESADSGGAGLTQKQTARLVGLSERRYREFEHGGLVHPDPRLLDEVARVLGMTAAERDTLYRLAAHWPPPPTYCPSSRDVRGLQPTLDEMGPIPALVTDVAWNALAWNRALAEDVADPAEIPEESRNSILWMLSSAAPERIPEVRGEYAMLVGRVRWRYLADGGRTSALHELVERLVQIPAAAKHWDAGVLALDPLYQPRILSHPAHGTGPVRTLSTQLPEQGLRLIVSIPDPAAP